MEDSCFIGIFGNIRLLRRRYSFQIIFADIDGNMCMHQCPDFQSQSDNISIDRIIEKCVFSVYSGYPRKSMNFLSLTHVFPFVFFLGFP